MNRAALDLRYSIEGRDKGVPVLPERERLWMIEADFPGIEHGDKVQIFNREKGFAYPAKLAALDLEDSVQSRMQSGKFGLFQGFEGFCRKYRRPGLPSRADLPPGHTKPLPKKKQSK